MPVFWTKLLVYRSTMTVKLACYRKAKRRTGTKTDLEIGSRVTLDRCIPTVGTCMYLCTNITRGEICGFTRKKEKDSSFYFRTNKSTQKGHSLRQSSFHFIAFLLVNLLSRSHSFLLYFFAVLLF